MVEISQEDKPSFYSLAKEELLLSDEEKEDLFKYEKAMLDAYANFAADPDDYGTHLTLSVIRDYAESVSPNGAVLVKKILEKEAELKSNYNSQHTY